MEGMPVTTATVVRTSNFTTQAESQTIATITTTTARDFSIKTKSADCADERRLFYRNLRLSAFICGSTNAGVMLWAGRGRRRRRHADTRPGERPLFARGPGRLVDRLAFIRRSRLPPSHHCPLEDVRRGFGRLHIYAYDETSLCRRLQHTLRTVARQIFNGDEIGFALFQHIHRRPLQHHRLLHRRDRRTVRRAE